VTWEAGNTEGKKKRERTTPADWKEKDVRSAVGKKKRNKLTRSMGG